MFSPTGIRVGTPQVTTRGFKEDHCKQVALLIIKLIFLADRIVFQLESADEAQKTIPVTKFLEMAKRDFSKELEAVSEEAKGLLEGFQLWY